MRLKTMLQTTAVLGLAVVAGLLGVSGTWALWSAAAPAQAGTLQAASFDPTVSTPTAPSGPLLPGTSVYSSFTVTNTTTASSDFRIEATISTHKATSKNTDLAQQLIVNTAPKPASGTCSVAKFQASPGPAVSSVIGKNQTAEFCIRFTLPAKAPSSFATSTASVPLTVTATQISPTTAT